MVSIFAGNDDLRADKDIGPLGLSLDLDSVTQGAGCWEGPAGSAVNGDVLVFLNGKVVDATDIAPPKVSRKVSQGDFGDFIDDMRLKVMVGDVSAVGRQVQGGKGAEDQDHKNDSIFHEIRNQIIL